MKYARFRFIEMMRRFYGPQWWKLYLRIARQYRKAAVAQAAKDTNYLELFDSFTHT